MLLSTKSSAVIEPDRCCVEDWEVLGFEDEEELHLYTIWHNDLRKSAADALEAAATAANTSSQLRSSQSSNRNQRRRRPNDLATITATATTLASVDNQQNQLAQVEEQIKLVKHQQQQPSITKYQQRKLRKRQLQLQRQHQQLLLHQQLPTQNNTNLLHGNQQPQILQQQQQQRTSIAAGIGATSGLATSANVERVLPPGFTIVNPSSEPASKYAIRYKSTKLYNKYRGQQIRTAAFLKKQREQQVVAGLSSGHLNTWLAYSALQALRLPPTDYLAPMHLIQQPTSMAASQPVGPTFVAPNNVALSPFAQSTPKPNISNGFKSPKPVTSTTDMPQLGTYIINSTNSYTNNNLPPHQQQQQQQQQVNLPTQQPFVPYHLIVVGPGKVIPYSNRIYPQQVAEYKRKSHLLPSTASSKKSSAASYDVNEIMEVLANSTKTNVTITRNAIKSSTAASNSNGLPSPSTKANSNSASSDRSVYSHTVNANAHGIVSTQLHLQARSYLDSMSKFYAEEWQLIEQRNQELMQEPSIEDEIGKYLNLGPTSSPASTTTIAPVTSCQQTSSVDC